VDVLQERNASLQPVTRELHESKRLRVGVAENFKSEAEVAAAFKTAVETIARLGHIMKQTVVPFAGPGTGIQQIERDRKAIGQELFGEIDVVLLPTTATTVPLATNAAANPQGLSSANTAFANYYGLPAMSVPCGFDSNGLPVGLQIVAGPSADLEVLTLGQQYERAGGRFNRHPTL
jgi:aspartyl-tRNA(Asn)/glutamyl-tRNA(Gln) amidotransferase subunit A